MSDKIPDQTVTTDTKNDKSSSIYATIAFIVVIIFIGVPMWWKTTNVYRVSLPYAEIENLSQEPIRSTVSIGFFIRSTEKRKILISELEEKFKNNFVFDVVFKEFELDDEDLLHAIVPAKLEQAILNKYTLKAGEFAFIEWPSMKDDILVMADRTAIISETVSSTKIHQVLTLWILQEYKLKSILGSLTTTRGRQMRPNNAPLQPNYDVIISVLNPWPDLQEVKWNARGAAEAYIAPFLTEISSISNFTLKSQWKYQVLMESTTKQVLDETKLGRHYQLLEENLPHIITSLEKKLGNQISNNPCIHLVVYVPPCQSGPIKIYSKNGIEKTANNSVESFTSAKWGGITIANPSETVCLKYMEDQQYSIVHLHSAEVMPILLYHLRKIFDFENNVPLIGASIESLDQIIPRKWEIDTFKRTNLIYFIQSATTTLNSLIQLLEGIDYIVINDKVGEAIRNSYEYIIMAKKNLLENNLDEAVVYAKLAHQNAELAFFDPSLLALLYFPGEQKYAIYIPLFLPIMIPVIFSLNSLRKYFKGPEKTNVSEAKKNE